MILVTGGLGFIGLHTARALIDLGEPVVLTQYRVAREPSFIKDDIGKNAFVEQLDVTSAEAFAAIGEKYEITGIVHLAVPGLGAYGPADDFRVNQMGLLNALQAAENWKVKRISIASSIAVYRNVRTIPHSEDIPLMLEASNPTEAFKKAGEVLALHYADRAGIDVVNLRIAGIWGPLYHSMANFPSRMVHAAVKKTPPVTVTPRGPTYAEDGWDMCYVVDCGRGIALLQVAESLPHRTYNVGSGWPTSNRQIVEAVQKVIPEFEAELVPGHAPGQPDEVGYLDLTRIKEATGYEPKFTTESAIADYIAWLRSGNEE